MKIKNLYENFRKLLGFEVEKPKIQEFIINLNKKKLIINYEKTILYIIFVYKLLNSFLNKFIVRLINYLNFC